jgi:hypothetical protein
MFRDIFNFLTQKPKNNFWDHNPYPHGFYPGLVYQIRSILDAPAVDRFFTSIERMIAKLRPKSQPKEDASSPQSPHDGPS